MAKKAKKRSDLPMKELYVKRDVDIWEAAGAGNLQKLDQLLKTGENVNCTNSESTPLHVAATAGQLEACVLLLEQGADTLMEDANEDTPYDLANNTIREIIVEKQANTIIHQKEIIKESQNKILELQKTADKLKNQLSESLLSQVKEENNLLLQQNGILQNHIKNQEKELSMAQSKINQQLQELQHVKKQDMIALSDLSSKNEKLQQIIEQEMKAKKQLSDSVSQVIEEKNQLLKQNTILQEQMKVFQQNQITVVLSELKITSQQKYDTLLKELSHLQNALLNEKDSKQKLELISTRNQQRREIVLCIDQMIRDASSTLVPQVESIVKDMLNKKLQHIFPVKQELTKDISMEQDILELGKESITELQTQLEEVMEDLKAFEKVLQKKPDDVSIAREVQFYKKKKLEAESKIKKYKEFSLMFSNRSNSLFGFPEMQASLFESLQQEQIEDLKRDYEMEKEATTYYVGIRKSNNSKVFIKKFNKLQDWKHFKTEVETLKRLNHQCVISINRVMYDNHFFYIEMPFIANGTLVDWLFKSTIYNEDSKNQRTPFEVQRMMRSVIQTIDYLHENGVLHRDLKMENIMMQNDAIPIIIDFDLSKDSQRSSVSTMKGGTHGYMDPAVIWGTASLNAKSDIYSFGITLLECFSKTPLRKSIIPLHNNKDAPDLKSSDLILQDEELILLLKKCLHKNQDARPSAREIVYSPFFLKHLSNTNELERKEQTDSRVMNFKKVTYGMKTSFDNQNAIFIQISGDKTIIEYFTHQMIEACNTSRIYNKMQVEFGGQAGVDVGALTTSAFRKYFEQMVEKKVLEKGSCCLHIAADDTKLNISPTLKREQLMIGLGIVLAKCLYEGRSIGSIPLSNALIKYLLAKDATSISVSLIDLEQFDFGYSNELNNMHLIDVSQLSLDFSGLKPNGEHIELNNQNLEEYISLSCKNKLIDSRRQNLAWIREGFDKMAKLREHLQPLHVNDFHILLTGEQMIDIFSIVNNCIVFLPLEGSNQQQFINWQEWMRQILLGLSQEEFKQFLLFCTGYCTTQTKDKLFENGNISSGYARDKISVRAMKNCQLNRLPESHVCFYLLDVPLYESKEQMEQKIKQAISFTDDFYALR